MKAKVLKNGSETSVHAREKREETVESLVNVVVRRGLATPTILVLELLKPLGFLGGQFLLLLQPFLGPMSQQAGCYASLLEDRESLERLLWRLDQERSVWKKGG